MSTCGSGVTTTPLCSQPSEDYRVGTCDVGPHYDPTVNGPTNRTNYSIECTRQTPEMCEIGDLTGKHTTINIAGESQQTLVCHVLETQSSRLAHITLYQLSHPHMHTPHTHHTHHTPHTCTHAHTTHTPHTCTHTTHTTHAHMHTPHTHSHACHFCNLLLLLYGHIPESDGCLCCGGPNTGHSRGEQR